MNMQQMVAQAQKLQRELKKAKDAFYAEEFSKSQAGLVTVVMYGNRNIKSITIEKDALDPENKEMIEDTILSVINSLSAELLEKEEEIEEAITGQKGMGF